MKQEALPVETYRCGEPLMEPSEEDLEMIIQEPDSGNPLCGTWRIIEEDSDDYPSAEYTVSVRDGSFQVSGIDRSDGEVFGISDIHWNGVTLSFHSYMPSTARCGISQVRYVGDGKVEFLFTFTVLEPWGRKTECSEQLGSGGGEEVG